MDPIIRFMACCKPKRCRVLGLHGPGLSAILIASGGSAVKIVGRNFHETTFRSFSDSDCDPVYLCQRHYGPNRYARQRGPSPDDTYFPIAVWLQNPANALRYKAAGFNTYVGLWKGPTEAQLAQLKAAGMKVICAQNSVGLAHLDDETIIGWMHGDEPEYAQSLVTGQGYWPPIAPARSSKTICALRPTTLTVPSCSTWDRAWRGTAGTAGESGPTTPRTIPSTSRAVILHHSTSIPPRTTVRRSRANSGMWPEASSGLLPGAARRKSCGTASNARGLTIPPARPRRIRSAPRSGCRLSRLDGIDLLRA